jgi:hypothetical protein
MNLIRTWADWAPVFRARKAELGLTYEDLDHRSRLAQGHCRQILNSKKRPTTPTLERLCVALDLQIVLAPVVDADRK